MSKFRTVTCTPQTKDAWDSLKRKLAVALDRSVRDPELVALLVELGQIQVVGLEKLAGEKKAKKPKKSGKTT